MYSKQQIEKTETSDKIFRYKSLNFNFSRRITCKYILQYIIISYKIQNINRLKDGLKFKVRKIALKIGFIIDSE